MAKLIAILFSLLSFDLQAKCHFEYGIYNVKARRVTRTIKVEDEVSPVKDKLGCTPCLEDQRTVRLTNGVEFKVCHKLAEKIRIILNQSIKAGFPIKEVIGYRASMSRGPLDSEGNRTKLSNHSFGSAIDINPEANGLYENCMEWNLACRLRKGGHYRPMVHPLSIVKDSTLIKNLASIGLKWGGELFGRQKDFMHFSPEGN